MKHCGKHITKHLNKYSVDCVKDCLNNSIKHSFKVFAMVGGPNKRSKVRGALSDEFTIKLKKKDFTRQSSDPSLNSSRILIPFHPFESD